MGGQQPLPLNALPSQGESPGSSAWQIPGKSPTAESESWQERFMLSAETSEFLEATAADLYGASSEQLEDESSLLLDELASIGADLDFPEQLSADFYLHAVYDSLLLQRAHTVTIGIKSLLSLCGQQAKRQQLLTQLWNLLDPQAASLVSAIFADIREDQSRRAEEPDLYEIATIDKVFAQADDLINHIRFDAEIVDRLLVLQVYQGLALAISAIWVVVLSHESNIEIAGALVDA